MNNEKSGKFHQNDHWNRTSMNVLIWLFLTGAKAFVPVRISGI